MNIFVSYTTIDTYINLELLTPLSKCLKKHGNPFIDLLHNNSDEKQDRVEKELNDADIFLFLKSDSVQMSKWVSWELNYARKLRIPCIELLVSEDIKMEKFLKEVEVKLSKQNKELTI